ncbi:MAG: hypothetical protein K2G55_02010 [Lachnospiraceae bacterium]|nr:hypothetical protein [Lachnospiraceae bacterium]MDE7204033.1 hypothetical protein [Lachnospiraceae bacterium]
MQQQNAVFPANPVYYSDIDATVWSYISFGSYPQTEVTGVDLTPEITEGNYDQYGDVWVAGARYRRISRDDTVDNKFFGENDFRYFKWEDIRWRVLWNDGKTLFVLSDRGLDNREFSKVYDRSDPWETCPLRKWLNSDFYNMAFDDKERESIVLQDISQAPDWFNAYRRSGNDTRDRIYLLSIAEATNQAYGFRGNWEDPERNYMEESKSRRLKASDYAHVMGAWIDTHYKKYRKNCKWWLRTSCVYTKEGSKVIEDGTICGVGYTPYMYQGAVVPAMHIKLDSDKWSVIELPDSEKPHRPPAVICL